MAEWDVVTVIIALVGLFSTVTVPILKLNSSISNLDKRISLSDQKQNDLEKEVGGIKKQIGDLEAEKSNKHKEMWDNQHKQDRMLENHERRLHDLDGKWFDGSKE